MAENRTLQQRRREDSPTNRITFNNKRALAQEIKSMGGAPDTTLDRLQRRRRSSLEQMLRDARVQAQPAAVNQRQPEVVIERKVSPPRARCGTRCMNLLRQMGDGIASGRDMFRATVYDPSSRYLLNTRIGRYMRNNPASSVARAAILAAALTNPYVQTASGRGFDATTSALRNAVCPSLVPVTRNQGDVTLVTTYSDDGARLIRGYVDGEEYTVVDPVVSFNQDPKRVRKEARRRLGKSKRKSVSRRRRSKSRRRSVSRRRSKSRRRSVSRRRFK